MISSFGQGVQGVKHPHPVDANSLERLASYAPDGGILPPHKVREVPLGVICFLTCFINLDSMKKDKFLFVFVREGRLVKKVE
jgi:hypothetical protein